MGTTENSVRKLSERRFDTSLALFEKTCYVVEISPRNGLGKKRLFFLRRSTAPCFSNNLFVEPGPIRGLLPEMSEGWLKLHRSLQDHPRASNSSWLSLWLHILLLATHKSTRMVFAGQIMDLKPGQLITSRIALSAKTGIHRSMVDRILQTMVDEHQIEQQTSTVSRLITICNWDRYQHVEPQSEPRVSHGRATNEPRIEPPTSNGNVLEVINPVTVVIEALDKLSHGRATVENGESQKSSTNKNIRSTRSTPLPPKGDEEELKLILDDPIQPQKTLQDDAVEVLDYLNKRTNQHFRLVENHLKNIKRRLVEVNCDVEGVRKMIDWRAREALGTEYERYLNPETLFRPKNFNRWYDQRNSPDRTQRIPGTGNP